MSLISQELRANSLSAAVSLSLGSLDSISVCLERLVTRCVVLLLYHVISFDFLVFLKDREVSCFFVLFYMRSLDENRENRRNKTLSFFRVRER